MTDLHEAWMGVTVDHLYEDCPSRSAAERSLREAGWWRQCSDRVDVDGDCLCRRCVNRYKRTKAAAS